ncbi:MAG: 30S ribosomal protein S11 [Parcubacteria group bacterium Gr01-1014_44]|nr:MAG: 30S ribosomal protein S11 [Parcubacteria group bacterium Gr01-1014_44]
MGKKRIITKAEVKEETSAEKSGPVSTSKKVLKRQVLKGIAAIFSSYNNTIVSITDQKGEVLSWSSAGSLGFKGARKSTPYAATMVAKEALEKAKKFNLSELGISVKGIGPGREAAIRALAGTGLNINSLVDNTPIPHGGVRPPKPRRV